MADRFRSVRTFRRHVHHRQQDDDHLLRLDHTCIRRRCRYDSRALRKRGSSSTDDDSSTTRDKRTVRTTECARQRECDNDKLHTVVSTDDEHEAQSAAGPDKHQVLEGIHQAAARCEASVGLTQRTMYASLVLPSFTTLATPAEYPLVSACFATRSSLRNPHVLILTIGPPRMITSPPEQRTFVVPFADNVA